MSQPSSSKITSIKLLLSNNLAGSLIGIGGKTIKELMETSGAKVHISSNSDPFPGSSDRVVVINGDFNSVNLAQSLIWEMVALATCAQNPRGVEWSPKDLLDNMGQNDIVEVTGKLTIPAAAGGLLIGKGGATIQSIAEQSGATVSMSGKDEAIFTHERVMTLSGTLSSCVECTKLILQKLDEPAELIQYVNRGTTYAITPAPMNAFSMPYGMPPTGPYGAYGTGMPSHPSANPSMGMGLNRPGGSRSGFHHHGGVSELDNQVTPVETTITFTVPDELVGNILGKQGSTMKEIIAISRAKITVSPRGESVEGSGGSSNRVVTITGSLSSAQTAHVLITQRLQTPAAPRRTPAQGRGTLA